jgi:hypothetical protein
VRDDPNLLLGAGVAVDEQPQGRLRQHDHEIGVAAQRFEHVRLVRCRLRENRVQRHDERLGELLRQREDVLASTPIGRSERDRPETFLRSYLGGVAARRYALTP